MLNTLGILVIIQCLLFSDELTLTLAVLPSFTSHSWVLTNADSFLLCSYPYSVCRDDTSPFKACTLARHVVRLLEIWFLLKIQK